MTRWLLCCLPLLGCSTSDLGLPCRATGPGDGGASLRANQALVRFGAMACESAVCVATADEAGLCSAPCLDDTSCAPAGLTCQALVLTEETLAALEADGAWLGTRQPRFCARAPPAG